MDLILMKPGDPDSLGIKGNVSMFDDKWHGNYGDNKADFQDCIELVSVNHGVTQQITTNVSNRARTSGRPNIRDIACVKYTDYSSPKLFEYCLSARPIGKGDKLTKIFIFRNSGDMMTNIMTFELRDAIISQMEFNSHPDDMPTEQFSLNFTWIRWTYNVQNNDMTAGGNVSAEWDCSCNHPKVD
jgi:type VI secretion system secreted protein Hcp